MRAIIPRLALSLAIGLFGTILQAQEFIGGNFMLRAPMDEPKHYCLDLDGLCEHHRHRCAADSAFVQRRLVARWHLQGGLSTARSDLLTRLRSLFGSYESARRRSA